MGILFSLYYMSMVCFSFIKNVFKCCLLLLLKSFFCMALMYSMFFSTWYCLVFFIVYMGGVYILLIFVSLHVPKSYKFVAMNLYVYFYLFMYFYEMFKYFMIFNTIPMEESFKLSSIEKGNMYVYLCFFLLLGFIAMSIISSSNESYIR